jgi:hypothetical protein
MVHQIAMAVLASWDIRWDTSHPKDESVYLHWLQMDVVNRSALWGVLWFLRWPDENGVMPSSQGSRQRVLY